MNALYEYIAQHYKPNEPIFTKELKSAVEMSDANFRQTIKRLSDKGLLMKVRKGIYFLPNKKSILKKPILDVREIVNRQYMKQEEEIVGYDTGTNFANSLGLTTQTASVPTVVTNNTSSLQRKVTLYDKKIIIKKPRVPVNRRNYRLLQVLDLLNDFDRISEETLDQARARIVDYLRQGEIDKEEIERSLRSYPAKTQVKFYASGVYNELTHG
ncbi:DUF6088 family protein [Exiguobacterium flavidum]|uniref:DUF6088 family protein n=1 Tax=Exiguobacterium flavidum TaxID=2184695 RepID=UPI000DF864E2|nr:DUF6088 family protein [Exiguobacterium flavidum]